MITVNLRDMHLKENLRALKVLKDFGFSGEYLQKKHDEQILNDKRSDNNAE
ncbi:MAG: hypothetical protein ACI4SX_03900 [Candidatus Fimenecus sp.]